MIDHSKCDHLKTKAGRSKCRRDRAKAAAAQAAPETAAPETAEAAHVAEEVAPVEEVADEKPEKAARPQRRPGRTKLTVA